MMSIEFPSPYGVLFILIGKTTFAEKLQYLAPFPSPYGVLFILMRTK